MKLRALAHAPVVLLAGGILGAVALSVATLLALQPAPSLEVGSRAAERQWFLDRSGRPLNEIRTERWNHRDRRPLAEIPPLLQAAFIAAEDQRFFAHGGSDWRARASALLQNLAARRVVRGASTITEQVVRLHHNRPRTVWSRWLEGFEAARLEAQNDKHAILEFYLNQVPYAAQRRGVVQAARFYFGRSLQTLSEKEMLALAVIVRAPRWFDPEHRPQALSDAVGRLAERMAADNALPIPLETLLAQSLTTHPDSQLVDTRHYLAAVRELQLRGRSVMTTLDLDLQVATQQLLDTALARISQVENGAALVADHRSGEVLAWVIGNAGNRTAAGVDFDAVRERRQPGSTLKPFVYAAALERGWTLATLIEDGPLTVGVGTGMHAIRNYSGGWYGRLALRDALGNSLNTPAVRTAQFVGTQGVLDTLRGVGFDSLDRSADHYGSGVALGNGEVTLLELVTAYGALARLGEYRPLRLTDAGPGSDVGRRVLSAATASLIGDTLADRNARRLEFGANSVLSFQRQTAVKTGTSNDHRDSWAVAFDGRFVAGVWMGNLDRGRTDGLSGARGPAPVLRAVLNRANRALEPLPLPRSASLLQAEVCLPVAGGDSERCHQRSEWFAPGTLASRSVLNDAAPSAGLTVPTDGLELAMDPRVPDAFERLRFEVDSSAPVAAVDWIIDEQWVGSSQQKYWTWSLIPGDHRVRARLRLVNGEHLSTREHRFSVRGSALETALN